MAFSFGQPSTNLPTFSFGTNTSSTPFGKPTSSTPFGKPTSCTTPTSTSGGGLKSPRPQNLVEALATLEAKDEMIALLIPPKSAKNEYVEQRPAKYVFKCMDGEIQIPEYGILRTEFYYQQVKARELDENGYMYNYKQFPRSSVKYFTDVLFGIMPKCKNTETLHLLNFLLFDGQANEGLCMFVYVMLATTMLVILLEDSLR